MSRSPYNSVHKATAARGNRHDMSDFSTNEQLQMAGDLIEKTGEHLFLTGKAGTGKTTFLHQLQSTTAKRFIVTAPTGVAAMNAGGVTLHSFFQLPFGPIVPNAPQRQPYRFSREKIRLIKTLDLLVIDEISMVRADMLDGIDAVLRRYRDARLPFGGVQLLLIGDLHQLPPVIKPQEQALLKDHYPSLYFFDSHALAQSGFISLELTEVFRQRDPRFIDLLNAVREERWTDDVLAVLNARHEAQATSGQASEQAITLTTHNHKADRINARHLLRLPGSETRFEARIDGDFPQTLYPLDAQLCLKPGCRVMFTRNDPNEAKQFYNGKMAQVESIENDRVRVIFEEDGQSFDVEPVDWQNVKYTLNSETGQIDEQVLGTFEQLPLRLAWAITVHKSQGLTFSHVRVDAEDAFSQGQIYVALSRCRSLEGLILTTPVGRPNVSADPVLQQFDARLQADRPDQAQLDQAQRRYQQLMLQQCFDFGALERALRQWLRQIGAMPSLIINRTYEELESLLTQVEQEWVVVSRKFQPVLENYCQQGPAEDNPELQHRLQRSADYFLPRLKTLEAVITGCDFSSDNARERKRLQNILTELADQTVVKIAEFSSFLQGFAVPSLLQARTRALLSAERRRPATKAKEAVLNESQVPFPELFERLKDWRRQEAQTQGVPAYAVMHQKALVQMVCHLPASTSALQSLPGVGPKTVERYGQALLDSVRRFAAEQAIDLEQYHFTPQPENAGDHATESSQATVAEPESTGVASYQTSVALFRQGLDVAAIAAQRGLAQSTVETHLAQALEKGELSLDTVLPDAGRAERIRAALKQDGDQGLGVVKAALGDDVSYGEIRWVRSAMPPLSQDNG